MKEEGLVGVDLDKDLEDLVAENVEEVDEENERRALK